MKRSKIQRHTPFSRGKGLKRTRMKQRAPKRLKRRAADAPYLDAIRKLACICCGRGGPSDAAHMPVGPRGMGLKAPDTSTVPLCRSCHLWFDGHAKPVLPKAERRDLAFMWLERTKERLANAA